MSDAIGLALVFLAFFLSGLGLGLILRPTRGLR